MADNSGDDRTSKQKAKSGIEAFGKSMSQQGQDMIRASQEGSQRAITQRESDPGLAERAEPGSYRRGGKVRRGGMARVHKGEKVLTRAQQKKLRKKLRTKKGRM